MDILMLSIGQLLFGLVLAGGIFIAVAVCYSTLYYMREDQAKDDKSETSWNQEHDFFHKIEEFRSDFA